MELILIKNVLESRCHKIGVNDWVKACCGDDGVEGVRWDGVDGLPF